METENKYKYYAFISYKREDEEWAKWLQHKLEHYKLPSNLNGRTDLPKEIRPVFKDTSELNPGNLPQQIHDALELSKFLIVICSPRSANSEWVNKEIETFMGIGKTDNIIPFIIDGKAFAKDPSEECFPLAIKSLPSEQEILGANIGEMGRDAAAVKVVAQMFGLKFDELWQRHEREQRRKRLLIILAALLLALTGVGVAVGFSQQNKRIREQNERITKQNEDILNKNERLQNDSIVMAAQMDSINKQDELITLQQDSLAASNYNLEQANENLWLANSLLTTERNNLKAANWKMMENLARFVVEKANNLVNDGNSYLAQKLLLEVLPSCINKPEKPYLIEVEAAFRNATNHNTAILKGHTDGVSSVGYSPNKKLIVSASEDYTIRIWDAQTGRTMNILEGHSYDVNSVTFSPDGKHIVSASYDNTVRIWDVETGIELNKMEGHTFIVKSVNYSLDGKRIVSASLDGTVRIWDAQTAREIGVLQNSFASPEFPANSAAFSPDGKYIVSNYGSHIGIWDAETGNKLKTLNAHTSSVVNSVTFSPDGKHIVSASYDNTVRIWDVETGTELKTLNGHTSSVNSAAFSPDGKHIFSASNDNTVRIWDVETGTELKTLNGPSSYTSASAAFSPDGKLIYSYSFGVACFWDSETGKTLNMPKGYYLDCWIRGLKPFSTDGKRIILFSDNSTAHVLNVEKEGVSMDLEGADIVTFSTDDKHIVSILKDNTIRIWDFPPLQELIDETRERFKDDPLTDEERRMYYLE